MWAIRRCKPGSKFTCQGKIKGGKCKKKVNLCKEGAWHQVFGGNATGRGVTMRHGYGFVVMMSNMCGMYVHIL
ncbi:hypothetical protein GOP47_0004310 [Adiantum capillus-veneris]|uniref:Uncharacterized protein n=1 Tax=Adiantum capillus-veneris TaxID=13818 RepID=A0A9D4ZPF9_ADICA|nr:hypothetical protein GOP47_0004310 [Adiantum capillus-veneris]